MSISVMFCYARSGGTLLNKCLGSLPGISVVSEVSPICGGAGGATSIRKQAKEWYDVDLTTSNFVDGAIELECALEEKGGSLVVRDWTIVCFEPSTMNKYAPESRLVTYEVLCSKAEVRCFALVRDSIDIFLSRPHVDSGKFFSAYRLYLDQLLANSDIKIFKYEDLCENPDETMKEICKHIDASFSQDFYNYSSFGMVMGDVQVKGGSRGTNQGRIQLLKRKWVKQKVRKQLNQSEDMIYCNTQLGYETRYESVTRETILEHFYAFIQRLIHYSRQRITYLARNFCIFSKSQGDAKILK